MPIIQVAPLTKEYRLGQLTRHKHAVLDDIAIGAASVSNTFVGGASPHAGARAAETEN